MNKEAIKIENNNYEPSVAQDVTPENKKNNNTKKIIAIVTSVIVVICLAVGIWFVVENNANKWDLKQNEVTIEYGEVYEPTIADLVDVEKYSNVTDDNTDVKVNATYEASKQNEELAYYAVGDYDIDVIHKIEYKLFGTTIFTMDDTKKIKLEVKDTVAPVFAEDVPTELETYRDCEIENLEEKFKANDIAPVTISIDKENIDYTTVGEYTINVYATDESGNVATKEIKVKVLEPSISIEPTILDMTVGNTANLTATVKGKDQTVEWTSSDESIAKVENGTVTAQKEGTTTVVAKANGTETSATVVVANVTQKKSSSNQNIGTTQSQGNKNSSSSASNGNSSSNSTGSSGGSTSSASTTTTAPSAYYCDEGGSHHRRNVGQIGWYSTSDEAFTATMEYISANGGSGNYTMSRCSCGKYTAYIK